MSLAASNVEPHTDTIPVAKGLTHYSVLKYREKTCLEEFIENLHRSPDNQDELFQ